jgi:hypothetical protein
MPKSYDNRSPGDQPWTQTAATCSTLRGTAKRANWQSAYAAATSRSGSIGSKTWQCSDLCPTISSSQPPARPRRSPSVQPSALRQVLGMQDGMKSLETFLTAAADPDHRTLGGCLASALAPCVANWLGRHVQPFRLYDRRAFGGQRRLRFLLKCAVHRSIRTQHGLPILQ